MDIHLQLFVHHKGYYTFLLEVASLGHIPCPAIMHTMDVVDLYPHIPLKEGLEAIEKLMYKSEWEMPVEDLVSLEKLVLENKICLNVIEGI